MFADFAHFGMLKVAVLVPLLPLAGAVLAGALGTRVLRRHTHWPVILGIAGAAFFSLMVMGVLATAPEDQHYHFRDTYRLYSWMQSARPTSLDVSFRIDPLTAIMLVTVCVISLLVAIYSRDYMREHDRPERGYERFFAFIGLFVASMCTLVLAGNFLLLYLGWELVGLCSYLLIGFYYQRPAAAAAAKKAFIVNRIGDFGFAVGVLLIYTWVSPLVEPGKNPLDYRVVFDVFPGLAAWQQEAVALLLFCGAVGKSAQLPLYVWLPDAMEGPTPVSALIHAATMVTAGVYMVARCGPIFVSAPLALSVVAAIGAVTAIFAASIALVQYDVKRILAYSTISQLGYMFLAVGVYAPDAAIFHLFTHAFFKALLFLAAGSVMHALGGVIDLRQFGGLRRVLPVTFITFVMGGLALSGFPFFSGFFSKDEIIHAAYLVHPVLGGLGLVTALMTAFYTFRMIFMAFYGPTRVPEGVHVHEPGGWMLLPMTLLALGAIGAGYVGVHVQSGGFLGFLEPHGPFHAFLDPAVRSYREAIAPVAPLVAEAPEGRPESHALMYVSAIVCLLGIAGAYVLYVPRRDIPERLKRNWSEIYLVLSNKYYVDELAETTIVQPLRWSGVGFFGFDRFFIDGLVWLVTAVPRTIGFVLRVLQNGALQSYGVTMTAGVVVLVIIIWLAR